jgi:GTP-binding protein
VTAITFTEEELKAGRKLFSAPARFVMGVASLEQLPPVKGVEIAFAGRSNVGKSSLINALTGVVGLARASNTPGRTRELNFFDVAGRLTMVDMPGCAQSLFARTAGPDADLCADRCTARCHGPRP